MQARTLSIGPLVGPVDTDLVAAIRYSRQTDLEQPMNAIHGLDDLAQRLAEMVPTGMKQAREDLTANFRSVLQAGLHKLDVVTREEFDVQRCVLLRTREKIEELERQLALLEQSLFEQSQSPPDR